MITSFMGSILPLNKILELVKKSLEKTLNHSIETFELVIEFDKKMMFFKVDSKKYRFEDGEKFIDIINKGLSEKNIDEKIDFVIIVYLPPNNIAKIFSTNKQGEKLLNEKQL